MTYPITPDPSLHIDPTAAADAKLQAEETLKSLQAMFAAVGPQLVKLILDAILQAFGLAKFDGTMNELLTKLQDIMGAIPASKIVGDIIAADNALRTFFFGSGTIGSEIAGTLVDASTGFFNQATSILKHLGTGANLGQFDLTQVFNRLSGANVTGALASDVTALWNQVTDGTNPISGYLAHLSHLGVIDAVSSVTGLPGYLTNLSAAGVFTDFTKIVDTSANQLAGYFTHLDHTGILALTGLASGSLPAGVTAAISNVTNLAGYLTNLNTSGVFTDFTKILDTGSNALSGYLAHLDHTGLLALTGLASGSLPAGVTAAISNVTNLAGYLTNLSAAGVFTDLTKIEDTGSNALSGYLTHLDHTGILALTGLGSGALPAGVTAAISNVTNLAGYLTHLSSSGVLDAVSSVTGLSGFLTNLSSSGVFTDITKIEDNLGHALSGYLTNMSTAGVFSPAGLGSGAIPAGVTAAISNVTNLAGYLTHLSSAGIMDAVSSVTGLPGYLTNLSTAGVFKDFTKIIDTGSNALSSYLTNIDHTGIFKDLTKIEDTSANALSGYLAQIDHTGIWTDLTKIKDTTGVTLGTLWQSGQTSNNLIISPNFEDSTIPRDPQPSTGATWGYSTTFARSGTQSYKVITSSSTSGQSDPSGFYLGPAGSIWGTPVAAGIKTQPGQWFYSEIYVRAATTNTTTAGSISMAAYIKDSTGVHGTSAVGIAPGVAMNAVSTSGWTKLSGWYQMPAGYDLLYPFVWTSGQNVANQTFYFDDVRLVERTEAQSIIQQLFSGTAILSEIAQVNIPHLTSGWGKTIDGSLLTGALAAGVTAAISNVTSLAGYLTNLSSAGVFTDITKIKDTGGNLLSAYLTNMSNAGVFSPSGLGSGSLPAGVTAAISNVTSLAGYLTHLSGSGVLDAISSVTGLPGYLTNINASGVFTDLTKIEDASANALSSYLTHMSSAGVFSPAGLGSGALPAGVTAAISNVTSLAGYLTHLSSAGVVDAVGSVTGLTGYLTHLNASGLLDAAAGLTGLLSLNNIPGLPTSQITSGTFGSQFYPMFLLKQQAGSNLVTDPSFENPAAWTPALNASIQISTDQAHSGTHSLKITGQQAAFLLVNDVNLVEVKTRPGEQYRFGAWIYPAAANAGTGSVFLTMNCYAADGTTYVSQLNSTNYATLTKGQWNYVETVFTIPANIFYFYAYMYQPSVPTTDIYYWDDVLVREVTEAQNVIQQLFGSSAIGSALTGVTLGAPLLTDLANIPNGGNDIPSLQGIIDAGVNAVNGTTGVVGQAFSDFENGLSDFVTGVYNVFGGHTAGIASVSDAKTSMTSLQGTVSDHTSQIRNIQNQLAGSNGLNYQLNLQQPETTFYDTAGTPTYTLPSWFTLSRDNLDVIVLGSGAGGDGSGVGASNGGSGNSTTVTVTDSGGSHNLVGTGGASEGNSPSQSGQGAGSQVYNNVTYVGGATRPGGAGSGLTGYPPGGGGACGSGFNRYGGGAGHWATASYVPTSSTIGVTIGAGGARGTGIGGNGGVGGDGGAWLVARPAVPSVFTNTLKTLITANLFRYNGATSNTDDETVVGVWNANPDNTGYHVVIQRADSTFSNYVYLLVFVSGSSTGWQIGYVSAGTATALAAGTVTDAIPFNAWSLSSSGTTYTAEVNGTTIYSVTSAAPATGASYRNGGWGSSDSIAPGSLATFSFLDSGTPSTTDTAVVATDLSTSSTTYTASLTGGSLPAVTFIVPQSGKVTVEVFTQTYNNSVSAMYLGFAMSGANTASASDAQAGQGTSWTTGTRSAPNTSVLGRWLLTGLTPGSTTFSAQGRTGAGTAHFVNSHITVNPE